MTGPVRAYPLPVPAVDGEDHRFTSGLLRDVAAVLEEHGYPPVRHSGDLIALQGVLYHFIYIGGPR